MIFTNDNLRPNPTYPTYPPYHTGDYIEDYFYKWVQNKSGALLRDYIAISWTTLYCENKDPGIQAFLNNLDNTQKYFTICQHDDAPKHKLPDDTLIFSLSRSRTDNPYIKNSVPTPLICSKIPSQPISHKDIFASFVGSITHSIRYKLYESCKNNTDFYFSGQGWSPVVSKNRMDEFLNISNRSKFTLCPRGYGNTSFRLYECMQLNSVPVYISNDFYLPWSDELNWNEFCVIVNESEIQNIGDILRNITDDQYNRMQTKIKEIYNAYFSLDGVCDNILKRIK